MYQRRICVAYAIEGANDLFITTKSTKRQSSWKPPNGFPSELKIKNSDTYTADIAARFQYIRDQMLLNENELTRVVRSLQCDLRQIKHAQAAATAQFNGWLAAAHLKLPKCTKLNQRRNRYRIEMQTNHRRLQNRSNQMWSPTPLQEFYNQRRRMVPSRVQTMLLDHWLRQLPRRTLRLPKRQLDPYQSRDSSLAARPSSLVPFRGHRLL